MPDCRVRMERMPTGETGGEVDVLVLEDASTQARAQLIPSRGALLSRWEVRGKPVLYLDESTLWDMGKSVRGGIPVLFPIAGRLPEDAYEARGGRYSLRQHGFARNLPWTLESSSGAQGTDAADVVLALSSSAQTLTSFPFMFDAKLQFRLRGESLRVTFTVTNRDGERMPLHYGLHPYFAVENARKAAASVEVQATRAHDNRSGNRVPFVKPDFTETELDMHLLDVSTARPVLHRPPFPSIRFEWAADFPVMVLWAVQGKDYICVEPWTAPGGALRSGEGVRWLEAGETATLPFEMVVEDPPSE